MVATGAGSTTRPQIDSLCSQSRRIKSWNPQVLVSVTFYLIATSLGSNGPMPSLFALQVVLFSDGRTLISFEYSWQATLVGHSFAGCPLSYAMEMYPNNVSKAIFLAAFTPRNNQSFLSSAFPTDICLAESLLTPTPYPISMEVLSLSNENYGCVRKIYIILMKDKLFLPAHQQYSVDQNPPER
ncbi:hypothetical protein KI387_037463, partial [Taxus chinensis]